MTPFETTLSLIKDEINSRLVRCDKIWVQANPKPNGNLFVFTIWIGNRYEMKFITIKNFRNIKIDRPEEYSTIIKNHIESFKPELKDFVKYD